MRQIKLKMLEGGVAGKSGSVVVKNWIEIISLGII